MLQADPPNFSQIPPEEIVGVTVILLTCSYKNQVRWQQWVGGVGLTTTENAWAVQEVVLGCIPGAGSVRLRGAAWPMEASELSARPPFAVPSSSSPRSCRSPWATEHAQPLLCGPVLCGPITRSLQPNVPLEAVPSASCPDHLMPVQPKRCPADACALAPSAVGHRSSSGWGIT